jgi:hypothetical protein
MGLLSFLPREEQYFDLFIQMTLYIFRRRARTKGDAGRQESRLREYAKRIKGSGTCLR